MSYHGDILLGATIDVKFSTTQFSTGAPFTLAGSPAVAAYPDNSTTEITDGITLTVDLDGRTGFHNVRVVATDANGFAIATNYSLVVTAGTVDSVSWVGRVVGSFSIEHRPLSPATRLAVASDVWDEILTGATHNIVNSAGRRLREIGAVAVRNATAQGGTVGSITLDASASAELNIYQGNLITILDNTGAGQSRIITAYNGDTKVANVNRNWAVTPDNTSVFQIFAFETFLFSREGIAQAGTVDSITLDSGASDDDTVYAGQTVFLTAGAGGGQARLITAYDGTTKVAVIAPDWQVIPDSGTVFKILPVGRTIVTQNTDKEGYSIAGASLQETTIETLTSQTEFTLAAGSSDDNAYYGGLVVITNAADATRKAVGEVQNYVGSSRTVTLRRDPGVFTMAAGDTVHIIAWVRREVSGFAL